MNVREDFGQADAQAAGRPDYNDRTQRTMNSEHNYVQLTHITQTSTIHASEIKYSVCQTLKPTTPAPLLTVELVVDELKTTTHDHSRVIVVAGGTKQDRALAFFKKHPSASRQWMLKQFMSMFDMTQAGAATYYTNIKKLAALEQAELAFKEVSHSLNELNTQFKKQGREYRSNKKKETMCV